MILNVHSGPTDRSLMPEESASAEILTGRVPKLTNLATPRPTGRVRALSASICVQSFPDHHRLNF